MWIQIIGNVKSGNKNMWICDFLRCIIFGLNFFTNLYWTLYFTINFIAIKFFVCYAYWAHPKGNNYFIPSFKIMELLFFTSKLKINYLIISYLSLIYSDNWRRYISRLNNDYNKNLEYYINIKESTVQSNPRKIII